MHLHIKGIYTHASPASITFAKGSFHSSFLRSPVPNPQRSGDQRFGPGLTNARSSGELVQLAHSSYHRGQHSAVGTHSAGAGTARPFHCLGPPPSITTNKQRSRRGEGAGERNGGLPQSHNQQSLWCLGAPPVANERPGHGPGRQRDRLSSRMRVV